MTWGLTTPPAAPCSSRATTSQVGEVASPAAALVTVNSAMPTTNALRRPRASPKRPAGTSARPKVSAYPERIHCRSLGRRVQRPAIEGTATLTMLTSSSVMKAATSPTPTACQRRRFSAAVTGCGVCAALIAPPVDPRSCMIDRYPGPRGANRAGWFRRSRHLAGAEPGTEVEAGHR